MRGTLRLGVHGEYYFRDVLFRELGLMIRSIDGLFKVHGAGGKLLQYSGYVEITVEFSDLGTEAVGALVLVVPATTYHGQVPFLVGTNLLKLVLSLQSGRRDQLPTPWQLAFKGLLHQQRSEMTDCPL